MLQNSNKQKLVDDIHHIIDFYSSDPELNKYFNESIKRLKDLLIRLDSQQVRIAIIGITSSGKSTLLNRLLGEKLLPTRVAPSSGKQVICGYGPKKQATIIFTQESQKQKMVVTENISTILERYGDEKGNPKNREQVDEIQVTTPTFRCDRTLLLIDTPGLDAFEQSAHEEITMKLVLPTVDMVMYLTNVKCESDKTNLEFIERCTSDDKLLLVVQNKIDSIEPKLTKSGGVLKTKDDVRQELYQRLKKLLGAAKKRSVAEAPVIQISARLPDPQSNLQPLCDSIAEQVARNQKWFLAKSVEQLRASLTQDAESLKSFLSETSERVKKKEQAEAILNEYRQHWADAQAYKEQIGNNLQSKIEDIINQHAKLIETIDYNYASSSSSGSGYFGNLSSSGMWGRLFGARSSRVTSANKSYNKTTSLDSTVSNKWDTFKHTIRDIPAYFSTAITEMQGKIRICCQDLNLQERQVYTPDSVGSLSLRDESITSEEKVGYHKKTVKRKTFGGWLKRGFGRMFGNDEWGYDEVDDEDRPIWETKYDIDKLVKMIHQNLVNLQTFFDDKYPTFEKQTDTALAVIEEHLESRQVEINTQFNSNLTADLVSNAMALLKQYQNSSDRPKTETKTPVIQNTQGKQAHIEEKYISCSYNELAINIAQLASLQCFNIHRRLTQDIIQKSGCPCHVIAGWDNDRMEQFRDIFFAGKATILNFNSPSVKCPASNSLVFLVMNADQSGSAQKKLYEGIAADYLNKVAAQGQIVWVMDAVKGLVDLTNPSHDSFADAFFELVKCAKHFLKNKPVYKFMTCDRELYYTVLINELYDGQRHTENDRQAAVKTLADSFNLSNERRSLTGKYYNDFDNLKKGEKINA